MENEALKKLNKDYMRHARKQARIEAIKKNREAVHNRRHIIFCAILLLLAVIYFIVGETFGFLSGDSEWSTSYLLCLMFLPCLMGVYVIAHQTKFDSKLDSTYVKVLCKSLDYESRRKVLLTEIKEKEKEVVNVIENI